MIREKGWRLVHDPQLIGTTIAGLIGGIAVCFAAWYIPSLVFSHQCLIEDINLKKEINRSFVDSISTSFGYWDRYQYIKCLGSGVKDVQFKLEYLKIAESYYGKYLEAIDPDVACNMVIGYFPKVIGENAKIIKLLFSEMRSEVVWYSYEDGDCILKGNIREKRKMLFETYSKLVDQLGKDISDEMKKGASNGKKLLTTTK